MFEDQSPARTPSVTADSMQSSFDFIDADISYTSILNPDETTTIDNLSDDQYMLLLRSIGDDSEMDISQYISSVNVFDNYPSTPITINSKSSDKNDEESFDPKEWIIEDSFFIKTRLPKLYEFLHLLLNNLRYMSYASWLNKDQGLFKIHKPIQVAGLWEKVKIRKSHRLMDYDTFARGIRHYYKSGVMIKTNTKHTYCFGRNKNL